MKKFRFCINLNDLKQFLLSMAVVAGITGIILTFFMTLLSELFP
jgi:hypothetical protein